MIFVLLLHKPVKFSMCMFNFRVIFHLCSCSQLVKQKSYINSSDINRFLHRIFHYSGFLCWFGNNHSTKRLPWNWQSWRNYSALFALSSWEHLYLFPDFILWIQWYLKFVMCRCVCYVWNFFVIHAVHLFEYRHLKHLLLYTVV